MKILDAVVDVLHHAEKPLKVDEIYKRIAASGLWHTSGKTPAQSISAAITTHIKKHGHQALLIRSKPGTYSLNPKVSQPKKNPAKTTKQNASKSSKRASSQTALSFKDCAEKVLRTFDKQQPMHYRTITEHALQKGWLTTTGKTPEATMNAQIVTEINLQKKRGLVPRFVKHGNGFYGLSKWQGEGLHFQINQHNKGIQKQLKQQLYELSPEQFEDFVAQFLTAIGFDLTETTPLSKDGGIDVRGTLVNFGLIRSKMAVQVKRYKNNVGSPTVREVRGSLDPHESGMIITTSDFTKDAKAEAITNKRKPITLMNGEMLVSLMIEHEFGVKRKQTDLYQISDTSLTNLLSTTE